MSQTSQPDLGGVPGGNTQSPGRRSRGWCFTLNNWTAEEYENLKISLEKIGAGYVIGKEVAPDTGTEHLQGYLRFKNQIVFSTVKKILPRAHIEVAKGSVKQNIAYCSKSDMEYISNLTGEEDARKPKFAEILKESCLREYENVVWREWQLEVLGLENDARTINWFWEPTGNVGKSFLCKYLACTRNVVICEGKKNDIFNQVKTMIDAEILPEMVICDVPRCSIEYLNYGAIEQLKNGLMYSGKYEGAQLVFPSPLVVVFANSEPDLRAMSVDRWKVTKIEE